MIKFKCTKCGEEMEAPVSMAGDVLECPKCRLHETVPAAILLQPKPEIVRAQVRSIVRNQPFCHLCDSPMVPGFTRNWTLYIVALLMMILGVLLLFASLCVGIVAGPVLFMIGLVIGACTRKKVLKCTNCGAIINRA